jgi:hypothetical protein
MVCRLSEEVIVSSDGEMRDIGIGEKDEETQSQLKTVAVISCDI